MQFHYITVETAWAKRNLMRDHSRARATIFADWPAPNYCGGFEGDVFDQPQFEPVWASVTLEGRTVAVGRMIPADGPCTMVEQCWSEGITTSLPDKATAVELHRIGHLPGLPKEIATLAVLKIQLGLCDLMLEAGKTASFFLTPLRVAETTLQHAIRHGDPVTVDGAPYVVVSTPIEADAVAFLRDTVTELEANLTAGSRADALAVAS